jgi:hypothetical protein
LERGFLGFGEALAKAHARSGLSLSRNEAKTQKDRFVCSINPNGHSIS